MLNVSRSHEVRRCNPVLKNESCHQLRRIRVLTIVGTGQSRVALEALQAQAGRGGAEGSARASPRLVMHASLLLTTLAALWFFKHESVSSVSRKIVSSVIFPVRTCLPVHLTPICCCCSALLCEGMPAIDAWRLPCLAPIMHVTSRSRIGRHSLKITPPCSLATAAASPHR